MSLVQIRYNTLCDDNHTFWRILIDGVEHTCSNIVINVPAYTTRDDVWDNGRQAMVNKHHLTCNPTTVTWKGDVVILD
jgi:hypothetical protein